MRKKDHKTKKNKPPVSRTLKHRNKAPLLFSVILLFLIAFIVFFIITSGGSSNEAEESDDMAIKNVATKLSPNESAAEIHIKQELVPHGIIFVDGKEEGESYLAISSNSNKESAISVINKGTLFLDNSKIEKTGPAGNVFSRVDSSALRTKTMNSQNLSKQISSSTAEQELGSDSFINSNENDFDPNRAPDPNFDPDIVPDPKYNPDRTPDPNLYPNLEPHEIVNPDNEFDPDFKPDLYRNPDPNLAPDIQGPDGTPGGAPPSLEQEGGARAGGQPNNMVGGTPIVDNASLDTIISEKKVGDIDGTGIGAQSSGVYVGSEGNAILSNIILNTNLGEGKGLCVIGKGSSITLTNASITTAGNSSHGVFVAENGSAILKNVNITTKGYHSSVLATDDGGGKVIAEGGNYVALGNYSSGVYSTGDIRVSNAKIKSEADNVVVLEYGSKVSLINTSLWSGKKGAVMIYQSFSYQGGRSEFRMNSGDISSDEGPIFYITNTNASITLNAVKLNAKSGIVMTVLKGDWGTDAPQAKPSRGGAVIFNIEQQNLTGDILVDEHSTINFSIKKQSTYTGTINTDNTGENVALFIDKSSTWEVVSDSYLDSFVLEEAPSDDSIANIIGNGHMVYYDKNLSGMLQGKTYLLTNGGKLLPRVKNKTTVSQLQSQRKQLYRVSNEEYENQNTYNIAESAAPSSPDRSYKNEDDYIIEDYFGPLMERMNLSKEKTDELYNFLAQNRKIWNDLEDELAYAPTEEDKDEIISELEILSLEIDRQLNSILGYEDYNKFSKSVNALGLFTSDPITELIKAMKGDDKISEEKVEELTTVMADIYLDFLSSTAPGIDGSSVFKVGVRDVDIVDKIADNLDSLKREYFRQAESILTETQLRTFRTIVRYQMDERKSFYNQPLGETF